MGKHEALRAVIISPERILFDNEVESISVPGAKGAFEILKHHAPIISSLVPGEIICSGMSPFSQTIQSGFVEVKDNVVTICIE